MTRIGTTAALAAILLAPLAAHADRALIIGVGQYQFEGTRGDGNPYCPGYSVCPITDLPGIDRDVDGMRKLVTDLGVPQANVRVLKDTEATLANVQKGLEWLLAAGPNERAYFYYSGHGSQVPDEDGDEDDGADETLVLHDAKPTEKSMAGMLVDDWLAPRLTAASAREVVLIVDACHSGTVTKSSTDAERLQFWKRYVARPIPERTSGANKSTRSAEFVESKSARTGRYVALTAVEDFQLAPATINGSPFTQAVQQVISKARADRRKISLRDTRDGAAQQLVAAGFPRTSVNPQLSGDPTLASAPLPLQSAPGARWSKLEQLVAQSTPGAISLSGTRDKYSVKAADPLELSVELKGEAYLWVFSVDRNDEAVLLLPNSWIEEVKLPAGKHRIPLDIKLPNPAQTLKFVPSAPGETLVVAVATPQKLKLPDDLKPTKATSLRYMPVSTDAADALLRQLIGPQRQFTAIVAEDQTPGPVTRPQAVGAVLNVTP